MPLGINRLPSTQCSPPCWNRISHSWQKKMLLDLFRLLECYREIRGDHVLDRSRRVDQILVDSCRDEMTIKQRFVLETKSTRGDQGRHFLSIVAPARKFLTIASVIPSRPETSSEILLLP